MVDELSCRIIMTDRTTSTVTLHCNDVPVSEVAKLHQFPTLTGEAGLMTSNECAVTGAETPSLPLSSAFGAGSARSKLSYILFFSSTSFFKHRVPRVLLMKTILAISEQFRVFTKLFVPLARDYYHAPLKIIVFVRPFVHSLVRLSIHPINHLSIPLLAEAVTPQWLGTPHQGVQGRCHVPRGCPWESNYFGIGSHTLLTL